MHILPGHACQRRRSLWQWCRPAPTVRGEEASSSLVPRPSSLVPRLSPLAPLSNKTERHSVILELIAARPVGSQEELRRLLRQRGWDVTQSTLSRDLRELRLARVPGPDGDRYAATEGSSMASRVTLDLLLPQLFDRLDGVGELLVLHTLPGGAQAIAFALDAESWPDVIGTIAGDDTILLVCRSAAAKEKVARRLRSLAGQGTGSGERGTGNG